jgi:hypothetical protein
MVRDFAAWETTILALQANERMDGLKISITAQKIGIQRNIQSICGCAIDL